MMKDHSQLLRSSPCASHRPFDAARLAATLQQLPRDCPPSLPRSQDPLSTVRNESSFQQLLPLNKALTAVRNDAKETCVAIAAVRAGTIARAHVLYAAAALSCNR